MAVPDIVWLVVLIVLAGSLAEVELLVKDALVLVADVELLVKDALVLVADVDVLVKDALVLVADVDVLVSLVDSEPEVLVT